MKPDNLTTTLAKLVETWKQEAAVAAAEADRIHRTAHGETDAAIRARARGETYTRCSLMLTTAIDDYLAALLTDPKEKTRSTLPLREALREEWRLFNGTGYSVREDKFFIALDAYVKGTVQDALDRYVPTFKSDAVRKAAKEEQLRKMYGGGDRSSNEPEGGLGGRHPDRVGQDPVHQVSDGTWHFWDETWSSRYGPYQSEPQVRDAFKKYAEKLVRKPVDPDYGPAAVDAKVRELEETIAGIEMPLTRSSGSTVTVEAVVHDELVYLATPYTHPDPAVRERRFLEAAKLAGLLMRGGKLFVYSPIAHTHPIVCSVPDLPGGWEFWNNYDRCLLRRCSRLIVADMAGWRDSKGVQAEIQIMRTFNKPITLLDTVTMVERPLMDVDRITPRKADPLLHHNAPAGPGEHL